MCSKANSTPVVSLDGKVAVVTGANSGIGLETALQLNLSGAKVYMLCRSEEKAKEAVQQMVERGATASRFIFDSCDMANFASVKQCAENILIAEEKLDLLINNAGIMFYPKHELTTDGHETTWQTNYLGPFLLTELLLPALKRADKARIVNISSRLHIRSKEIDLTKIDEVEEWGLMASYNRSKLANVMHARDLSRRLKQEGCQRITANSLHPGVVNTNLSRHFFYTMGAPFRYLFMKTPQDGAKTSLHVALSPEVEGVTAKYFSDSKLATENKLALNDSDCEKLYNYSVQQVARYIN